jgi:hypothetical protein
MEDPAIPSSFIGALTFFLLLGIIAFVVIRETVKVVIKPALVIMALALVAVWAGVLDETVVGGWFEWTGEHVLTALHAVSDWVAESWPSRPDS